MLAVLAMVLFAATALWMVHLARGIPTPPPIISSAEFFWLLRYRRYGSALFCALLMVLSWVLRATVWTFLTAFIGALGAVALAVAGWQWPEVLREVRGMLQDYYDQHRPAAAPSS